MAKYSVTYGCGHTVTESLFGKITDRLRTIEAAKDKICKDCYKAEQVEKAARIEVDAGLIPLEGSKKQVAWARTIRAKFIEELEPLMAAHGHKLGEVELETIKSLRETVSASWWIEQRNNSLQTILIALAKNNKAEKGA